MNKPTQRRNLAVEIDSASTSGKRKILWTVLILLPVLVVGGTVAFFLTQAPTGGDDAEMAEYTSPAAPAESGSPEPAAAAMAPVDPWAGAARPPTVIKVEGPATNSWINLGRGPRGDEDGKRFLNIQGRAMTRFGSYAVIEFKPELPAPLARAGSTAIPHRGVLNLAQSVAQFSKPGRYSVWLAPGDVSDRALSTAPFDAAAGIGGIDPISNPLGELIRLRNQEFFSPTTTGRVDNVALEIPAIAGRLIRDRLLKGEAIYLVLIAEDADVAATFAGSSSNRADPPSIELFFETVAGN